MATSSSSSNRDPLERLAAEFLDRRRRGENPSPSGYADQYPQWADQILEFFPALELMEGLKPGSRRPDRFAHPARAGTAVAPQLQQLGEYRILREIGRGGMGVVYEAVQESLGRRVALKILPLHGRIDPVQMERFQLESRSAARLHHTGIVPVHGVGEHGGVHYYAMQYIQGHGLDVILEDLRRLRGGAAALPPSAGDRGSKGDAGSMAVARSLLTGRFPGPQPDRETGTQAVTSADGETGSNWKRRRFASRPPRASHPCSPSRPSQATFGPWRGWVSRLPRRWHTPTGRVCCIVISSRRTSCSTSTAMSGSRTSGWPSWKGAMARPRPATSSAHFATWRRNGLRAGPTAAVTSTAWG